VASVMASATRSQRRADLISSPYRTVVMPGPGPGDDRRDLRALVASGLFGSYVSYECPGRRWFAGNVLAELIMTETAISWRIVDDDWVSAPVGRRPLRQLGDVARALPLRDYRLFGYLAFELGRLADADLADDGLPDADLATAGSPATLAHLMVPQVELEWSADGTVIRAVDDLMTERILDLLLAPRAAAGGAPTAVDLTPAGDRRAYEAAVAAVVDDIRGGLLHKAIISRQIDVPFPVDLPASYLLGLEDQMPARSFLLDLGGRRCAGFSPETVVEVGPDGEVRTQPLAGTRPLRRDRDEDRRLREELEWDVKECYEHVISVRLAATEMAVVCDPATVAVRGLLDVKERGTVQHLGSAVTGSLRPGLDSWDAVEALFPAVTASGIPKRDALRLIAAMESSPRQLYAGMVGIAGSDGFFDGAVVLRSIFQDESGTWLRAGAGIVADSDPASEYEETTSKLRSAAGCLVAALADGRPPGVTRNDARSESMPDAGEPQPVGPGPAEVTADVVGDALHEALANLGVAEETIVPAASLRDDLELDSIDIVQVEQDLTKKLGVRVEFGGHADLTVSTARERVLGLLGSVDTRP